MGALGAKNEVTQSTGLEDTPLGVLGCGSGCTRLGEDWGWGH